ncbi:flagellar basal body-associated protein FliL [Cytobacillus firmus]|uniref:flagellar basal body-associated protein FliL n=1 Tax=Cytobacillus firmus TaxID=1399 RepID=UPI00237BC90E|nr:flagellar basal body-associated protein FliL [Cytobacillus firmus]MDD9312790.1 flagellar basal body-associated protein FliL [Cytobacillus firmus]
MKNNKLLMIMLMMLVAITLIGAIALVLVMKFSGDNETKEPTIDEVLEASVDIPQVTANLANDDYIRISFKIQTENKKAKEELQKRDFQVKNLIIQELSEMKAEDIQGKEGQIKLQEDLKTKINGLMQEGKIVQVYIIESLLQ